MNSEMKIAIDCDGVAADLKKIIFDHVKSKGINIEDLNFNGVNPGADYPEIGYNLAFYIREGRFDRGILICGTGLGMAMIANKVEGVYAGVCHDAYSAERLRKSNDAQVLTMGALVIGPEHAKVVVDAWLESEFSGGRSQPKVNKMREIEKISFGRSADAENNQRSR